MLNRKGAISPMRTGSRTKIGWRAAIAFVVAFVVAISTGHGNLASYIAIADQLAVSADTAHGYPSHNDHGDEQSTECMACPSSICCFIAPNSGGVAGDIRRPVVIPVASRYPASSLSDGPLRPPNWIGA